jgi:hypothetical protein
MTRPTRTLATLTLAAGVILGGLCGTAGPVHAIHVDGGTAMHRRYHHRPGRPAAPSATVGSALRLAGCVGCGQHPLVRAQVVHDDPRTTALVSSAEALLAKRGDGHNVLVDLVAHVVH